MINTSSENMGNIRLSTKKGTHHTVYIFASIMICTSRSVKRQRYQSITGQFHRASGKSWRKKKRAAR